MKQELLIRLFRSIDKNEKDDILKIAKTIIDEKILQGHNKLAERLKNILDKNNDLIGNEMHYNREMKSLKNSLEALPTDNRNNIPLVSILSRDNLRHEMILDKKIESKIQRIEKEYTARIRLAHYGLKPRKKILFYGAPGCGKSMSAERIAWNVGLPFLKVKFEAIISSYLGESASNLVKLFNSIKDYPCVLLLDEFDFIAKSRTTNYDVGEMKRVVNVLLNILEEYEAPGLLIATTNIEGSLDKALFRRFDDIIELTKPGTKEIILILKKSLSAMNVEKEIEWSNLGSKMKGLPAALIVKIANDAAKTAVLQNSKIVQREHLISALNENAGYNK